MILSEMNAKKRWICAASPGRVVAQCQFENGGYLKDAIKCTHWSWENTKNSNFLSSVSLREICLVDFRTPCIDRIWQGGIIGLNSTGFDDGQHFILPYHIAIPVENRVGPSVEFHRDKTVLLAEDRAGTGPSDIWGHTCGHHIAKTWSKLYYKSIPVWRSNIRFVKTTEVLNINSNFSVYLSVWRDNSWAVAPILMNFF